MFASLSSLFPSVVQQVPLRGARSPDASSPPPSPPPAAPVADPPRKKEKKEKHASEVCPPLVSVSTSHLATRHSSSSALHHQSLLSHSASNSSLFLRSPVTTSPYKHSTPLPMISTPISNAPTPMDQRHPPTQATPRPPLSPLSHPPPPSARVVARSSLSII